MISGQKYACSAPYGPLKPVRDLSIGNRQKQSELARLRSGTVTRRDPNGMSGMIVARE